MYEQQKAAKERIKARRAKEQTNRNTLIRLERHQAKMKIGGGEQ